MPLSERFIDPAILASLANLNFLAKTVVDGFMLGYHGIPRSGAGLEFSQYRSYQPGDDLRQLDWKMYARSDRYYVRETETESSINIRFALDTSASMGHTDTNGVAKSDYGRYIAASLGHLSYHQGDAIGLYLLGGHSEQLPPRHTRQHYHRFLDTLANRRFEGVWPDWTQIEQLTGHRARRELLVVISDLYADDGRMEEALARLSGVRNEVVVFHLLSRNEFDLPWRGPVIFEDLETGRRMETVPDRFREQHRVVMEKAGGQWGSRLGDLGATYHCLVTDQPLDEALHTFLKRRLRSERG